MKLTIRQLVECMILIVNFVYDTTSSSTSIQTQIDTSTKFSRVGRRDSVTAVGTAVERL